MGTSNKEVSKEMTVENSDSQTFVTVGIVKTPLVAPFPR